MFTVEERDQAQGRLLELAEADPAVVGAAVTGSTATGSIDRWSDIDLAFAVHGELRAVLERWTTRLYSDFAAVHHWDLPSGTTIYRVFLLPEWLEVDIAFTPEADFGPRGPAWRTVFGRTTRPAPASPPSRDDLVGMAWHHALHARVCIERRRPWQAEHWTSALRDHILALACLRHGYPTSYAKGVHLLPAHVTAPLEPALVRSLDDVELQRAFSAALTALEDELRRIDPVLAARLQPMLAELSSG